MIRAPMVEVTWHDASSFGLWDDPAAYAKREPVEIKSVGYLLQRTAKKMLLVQSRSSGDRVNDGLVIPAPWITRVRHLSHRRRKNA